MPKLYPVVDRLHHEDLASLGITTVMGYQARNVHAVATGERRPPKRGEWYLSGAIVEAYRAPNDLSMTFPIARLVKTKTVTVTTIVQD
jgi:hypothetical protein